MPPSLIGRYDKPDAAAGEVICYGQQITFTTLPDEGGQVSPSLYIRVRALILAYVIIIIIIIIIYVTNFIFH